jgi:hypothetical protein
MGTWVADAIVTPMIVADAHFVADEPGSSENPKMNR